MSSIRKRTWASTGAEVKSAWLVDYRDTAGTRRSKQFRRKKDAEAWLTNAAIEVQRGIHTADSVSITVSEAAQLWLDSVRANDREPTTIASYEQHVRLHIVPKCGGMKLSQLTAPKVKSMLDEWLLHLSRSMAVRVLRSLKAILTEAHERGLIGQNVALTIKPRKMSRVRGKASVPSKAALRGVLKAAEESDDRKARALVTLALFSGLRASELRGLAWPHVDLKTGRLNVEQRADASGIIGPPKSKAGYRTIPLPARAVSALKEWKLACPPHPDRLVFPSEKGRPLSHAVMTKKLVRPLMPDAAFGMHGFRHAAASLWIDRGLNPKRVQYLMGHSSIQVTFDTYGHLFEQAVKDTQDADAIEVALFADAT